MEAIVDPGALERARHGDASAFDSLVEARVPTMLRTAMAITGREAAARDAVQDALVSAWSELPALRDPAAFDATAVSTRGHTRGAGPDMVLGCAT